jgi:hypothetical protein
MSIETLLVLSGMGVPSYSARGISQKLEPISAASSMRRTVNGVLRDNSLPQFRKYKTVISCNDHDAPAIDGFWPGMEVVVDCVDELVFEGSGPAQRTVVPGSSWTDSEGFTHYRPRLSMRITSLQETKDEWGATTAWQMELEEI